MSVRAAVSRGGTYLALREIAGIALRSLGILLVTRLLGPTNYGVYSGAVAIITPLAGIAQLGAVIYLVRQPDEPDRRQYDAVWTMLLVSSFTTVGAGLLVALVIDQFEATKVYTAPLLILLISLPINVLWAPGQAMLERELRYKALAWVEIGGDAVLYVTSITLVLAGLGVHALLLGYIAWQTWLLASSLFLARYRPRIHFSLDVLRAAAGQGASSVLVTIAQRSAPGLIVALVVGGLGGPKAVGLVNFSTRLVENLAFVTRATQRLSLVALSRVQDDRRRFDAGAEDAIVLQLLAVGPVLVTFATLSPMLIPTVFGEQWRPAVDVFPLVACGSLFATVLIVQSSALFVRGRAGAAARFSGVQAATIGVTAAACVPLVGAPGYGVGWIVGMALVLGWRPKGAANVRVLAVIPWIVAFGLALLSPLFDAPALKLAAFTGILLVGLVPRTRLQASNQLRGLWRMRKRRADAASPVDDQRG